MYRVNPFCDYIHINIDFSICFTENTVFSFIPNTAETSFYGMLEAAQDELNKQKNEAILREENGLTDEKLKEILDIPVFHDDQHGTAIICLELASWFLRRVDYNPEPAGVPRASYDTVRVLNQVLHFEMPSAVQDVVLDLERARTYYQSGLRRCPNSIPLWRLASALEKMR